MFQQVYETLVSYAGLTKVLQFVPFEYDGVFVVHCQDDRVDIGVSKQKYLKIFKEAHDYWYQHQCQFNLIDTLGDTELNEVYYVTVCYLMTTNDHHLINRAHEQALIELYKRDSSVLTRELEIITTLVSSKLKKINKNSLLWHLIRRLSIMLDVQSSPTYGVLIKRVIQSCENHFANYYANYYLSWLIHINYVVDANCNRVVLNEVVLVCHRCLSDVSLWSNLRVLLFSTEHIEAVQDYNHLVNDTNAKFGTLLSEITPVSSTPLEYDVAQEMHWLLAVECPYLTPYLLVMNCETIELVRSKVALVKGSCGQGDGEANTAISSTINSSSTTALSSLTVLQKVLDKASRV